MSLGEFLGALGMRTITKLRKSYNQHEILSILRDEELEGEESDDEENEEDDDNGFGEEDDGEQQIVPNQDGIPEGNSNDPNGTDETNTIPSSSSSTRMVDEEKKENLQISTAHGEENRHDQSSVSNTAQEPGTSMIDSDGKPASLPQASAMADNVNQSSEQRNANATTDNQPTPSEEGAAQKPDATLNQQQEQQATAAEAKDNNDPLNMILGLLGNPTGLSNQNAVFGHQLQQTFINLINSAAQGDQTAIMRSMIGINALPVMMQMMMLQPSAVSLPPPGAVGQPSTDAEPPLKTVENLPANAAGSNESTGSATQPLGTNAQLDNAKAKKKEEEENDDEEDDDNGLGGKDDGEEKKEEEKTSAGGGAAALEEKHTPYANTHKDMVNDANAIVAAVEDEYDSGVVGGVDVKTLKTGIVRTAADTLGDTTAKGLLGQLKQSFKTYSSAVDGGAKDGGSKALRKKYRKIIENLIVKLSGLASESEKNDRQGTDVNTLAHKRNVCNFVESADSETVSSYYKLNETFKSEIKPSGNRDKDVKDNADSFPVPELALMLAIENTIQADAYREHYTNSTEKILGKKQRGYGYDDDDDDDDDRLSSKKGKAYDIRSCYLATGRMISNVIVAIETINETEPKRPLPKTFEDLKTMCEKCMDGADVNSGVINDLKQNLSRLLNKANNDRTKVFVPEDNAKTECLQTMLQTLAKIPNVLSTSIKLGAKTANISNLLKEVCGKFDHLEQGKFKNPSQIMENIFEDKKYDSNAHVKM